jgi:2'-5' RNA ligase
LPRTALIIEVPQAEPLVHDLRWEHDNASIGIPAHVTVLFPFVAVEHVDDVLLDGLQRLFAAEPAFEFSLPRVGRFPDHVWLAPEPAEPFKRLTTLVHERYPDYPPYEGIHDEVIPHLTVGQVEGALQDVLEAQLTPGLPIAARAHEVTLLVEDDTGHWQPGPRFPLAG